VVLVALDKALRPVREVCDAIWDAAPGVNIVALDAFVDVRNLSDAAWRALGNVDWRRDIAIRGGPIDHFAEDDGPRGQIGIDATTKTADDGHPRGWPVEIAMSEDVRQRVDEKWSQVGV
jgi:4-hydroxy-3-polyprenylbenzoate decarboxylase